MAYNYHGSWNEYTGHHSGLYPRSDESGGEREWNQVKFRMESYIDQSMTDDYG